MSNVIYEPRGKAREYSPLALNLYTGCAHGCRYCYGPSCLQKGKDVYFAVPEPRKNIIESLKRELAQKRPTCQVMLSFVGDVYGEATDDNDVTRQALEVLLENRVPVAVLTKAGKRCLRDIELFKAFGEYIQIGASLTFDNDTDSLDWEPRAALPADRLFALEELQRAGVKTFASFEPVIKPYQSLRMMEQGLGFIDVYKVGKLNNYMGFDKGIDWTAFLQNTLDILRPAGKQIYIKHDLRLAAPSIRLYGNEVLPDEHNV